MEKEKIYRVVYQIDSDDFILWITENIDELDKKCLEINPQINTDRCKYNVNMFIGDDWDCYQGYLLQDDDIEKYKDEPYIVAKEAMVRLFFEQNPECKDKSVILVRS